MPTVALSISDVSKIYKNDIVALNRVSFSVAEGDFFCLLGPNGAGKTTAIGIVTSLVIKTAGTISVFNHNIDHHLLKAKQCLGVMPQEVNLNIFATCFMVLLRQGGYYGLSRKIAKQRAERLLKLLLLWDKRDDVVARLSGGMKRRLMIARALMNDPKLLILDEPTAGVDVEIRRSIWDFLRELNQQGTTILLTTHYLEEAETLCNKVALIDRGEIQYQGLLNDFLNTLDIETVIVSSKNPINCLPQQGDFMWRQLDANTLEVDLQKSMSMSELVALLTTKGIDIYRIRNKFNRLEQLFVKLTTRKEE